MRRARDRGGFSVVSSLPLCSFLFFSRRARDEGEGLAGLGPDDSMLERMMARSLAADEEEEEEQAEAEAEAAVVARPVVASGRSSMLGARGDEDAPRASMLGPMPAARTDSSSRSTPPLGVPGA